MTDERRWTVLVCVECDALVDVCGCEPDWDGNEPRVREVVVVPVSSVVPITRLREWIEESRDIVCELSMFKPESGAARAVGLAILRSLAAFLDDLECASNPNNERTNDA